MHFLKQLAKYGSEHSLVDSVSVYINCRRTVLAQCLSEPIPHPSSALPPKWLFISVWTKKLFPLQKQLLKQKEKRKHSTRWCLPHIFFSVECSQSRTANLSPGFVREAQKKLFCIMCAVKIKIETIPNWHIQQKMFNISLEHHLILFCSNCLNLNPFESQH